VLTYAKKYFLLVFTVLVLISCSDSRLSESVDVRATQAQTTYERFLPLAVSGDPELQNLIGFMHFHGEGVERDPIEAHRWFHMSAKKGHPVGRRNDLYMHDLLSSRSGGTPYLKTTNSIPPGVPVVSSKSDTVVKSNRIVRGERIYVTFCAGCHGLNGIAVFVGSPSFALNARMEKSDQQLLRSVSNGIGAMPGWREKLPDNYLIDTIAFIRTLRASYQAGISSDMRGAPDRYFLFGVMKDNDSAYRE